MSVIVACAYALLGTGFTFTMTSCGAAAVFLVKGKKSEKMQNLFLGFASGVMLAASVWSLLLPALDRAKDLVRIPYIPVMGGFLLGSVLFYILDSVLLRLTEEYQNTSDIKEISKLFAAITLHNIPEGMAVGLSFALAIQDPVNNPIAASIALATAIGVQNFPEGAAISLPLHQKGMRKRRAFFYGSLSGCVEPVGGVLTVFLVGTVKYLLPWLLSFAAGAMIYVVVDELIPASQTGERSNLGTIGAMIGFLIMMTLDVVVK